MLTWSVTMTSRKRKLGNGSPVCMKNIQKYSLVCAMLVLELDYIGRRDLDFILPALILQGL